MDETLKVEKQHLAHVVDKLKLAKLALEQSLTAVGDSNLERLKELRETEYGPEFEMFLEQLHEKNESVNLKDRFKRVEELTFLLKEPYFARIDLAEKAEVSQPFYIGKFGYTEDKPVVIDWRAKVASVYYRYRYPQKGVTYDTPGGLEERDLTLKRTYEIEDAELVKYYNNDIQLDENEIILDKLQKRTGGVLEDIVETIQISQMDIIEADPRQVCMVQGCVGSGKSTVAIHKLAHIFFNHPTLIHSARSVLVAKNQILVGYLSTLFPKLGIFDLNFKTLRELMVHIVFREELDIQIDLNSGQDTTRINLKKIEDFNKKVQRVHDVYRNKINDIFSNPEYASFAGFKYSDNMTPFENLNEAVNDIEEELQMQKDSLKDVAPNSIKAFLFKENIKTIRSLVKKLADLRTQIKKKSLPALVKEMGLKLNTKMDYLETLLYLVAYAELVGITKYPRYEYCVIDEGQDFSVLEYLFLSKIVLRGRLAIFGDLNQSVESDGIRSWEDIPAVVAEAKNASTFELDTNYRSTKPIIDLACNILKPYTSKYLPKSINRKGNDPVIKIFSSQEELLSQFASEINDDAKKLDKSIGIICYDEIVFDAATKIIDQLKVDNEHIIKLDSTTKIRYLPKGVYIMRGEDCKGLEFAKVYILNLNLAKISSAEYARKAFVSITRAMNELHVYGL